MYLHELKLWNFRKYGSDTFDLNKPHLIVPFTNGLNVLIGENDSGKTTIIDAIKLVLKTHAFEWIKIEDKDFYEKTLKLRIELGFKGLKPNESKNFIEWLGWEGQGDKAEPILKLIYQVERNENRVLPSDVKAGMDDTGYPLNAEAREYLKTTYLKALRDAESDLTAKKNSRLSQILQEHELFKKGNKSNKHLFEEEFFLINKKIEDWFKDDNKVENCDKSNKSQIKGKIDGFLESFIENGIQSKFSLGPPEIKNILEKISLGIEGSNNFGLGTMNRLYMAAELLHLKKEWDGLKLCLIEEFEAHLHPQAQMKVIEALQKQNDVQYILTTHSPNLASKVKLHNLILCKESDVFPLGEESNEANKKSKVDKYTKLSKDDYKYLERFLDVTKSNLFFAKGVIIVEGWSEEILIPVLAKLLGYDFAKKEISIINVASTAYLHFAKIFLRNDGKLLKTPVSIVTDLDNKPNSEGEFDEEERLKKEGSINKIQTDIVGTTLILCRAKEWTLEWCLLKSPSLTTLFKEAISEVHSNTNEFKKNGNNFDESEFEKKLTEKLKKRTLDKVEIATVLAEKIESQKPALDEKDEYISYLIEAIKHACN